LQFSDRYPFETSGRDFRRIPEYQITAPHYKTNMAKSGGKDKQKQKINYSNVSKKKVFISAVLMIL